ncbi:unnamed protein product [Closterium sp. NIES-54]
MPSQQVLPSPAASSSFMPSTQVGEEEEEAASKRFTGVTKKKGKNEWVARIVLDPNSNSLIVISSHFQSEVAAARSIAAASHVMFVDNPTRGDLIPLTDVDRAKLQGCTAQQCELMVRQKFWHKWEQWAEYWPAAKAKYDEKERKAAMKRAALDRSLGQPGGRPDKMARTCDRADGLSLFDLTSGVSPAPPATADSTVRSQWATRDAAARLAVRRHLPTTDRAHFSQYKSAQTLYDAVVARYSSPATAALSRLFLPYLFPDLAAFPTVADLITHLRTSDTRYRAALPAEFCAKNPPPIYLTLYYVVLQRFDFTYSSPQATPLSTRHSLSALPSDESVEPSGPYLELVSCLMYLMTCTRPDLAYPLSILARYVAPGRHRPEHMAAAKRVLRYLCSTSGMGLVLGGRRPVVLTGHADASWADDQATQRSSQGYTFSLGSGSVSWRSTRSSSVLSSSCEAEIYAWAMAAQELRWLTYLLTDLGEQPRSPPVLYVDNKAMLAFSSCEAEIYAWAMAAQELRWLTYLLTDLGEQPRSPPVLYVDNKAMLALCREHRLEHRTKHIALRYFLARELQQRGQLRLAYVASEANTADIFTKALARGDHQRFCTMLGLVPTWPHLLTS